MWFTSNQIRVHKSNINNIVHEVINYVFIYYNIYCHLTHTPNFSVKVSFANTPALGLKRYLNMEGSKLEG